MAAVVLAFATVAVAWVDHVSAQGAVVAQNVGFHGTEISGLTSTEASHLVETRGEAVLATPIEIDTGAEVVVFPAGDLGFRYESEAVLGAIMSARHDGGPFGDLLSWALSPLSRIEIVDVVSHDADRARRALDGYERMILTEPTEPEISVEGSNELYVTPGQPGVAVDVEDLVRRLGATTPSGDTLHFDTREMPIPPTVTDEAAQAEADRLNELTDPGVEVSVGEWDGRLSAPVLRQYLGADIADGDIVVELDLEGIHSEMERRFTRLVGPMGRPVFDVVDDGVIVVSKGEPPPVCCDFDSVSQTFERWLEGAPGPFRIEPRPSTDPEHLAWAEGSSVTAKVSEFTTSHPCCEARVTNIHRIADLVRGLYILPGETVSLNEHVGERTRERGFVAAGAIRAGRMVPEVGGGVSQFATTIFNAAYFAGLDFEEYRAHSLYFSRYPFGREATISSPAPDLILSNTTDHPVLIWTSYDATSITVSIYSTPHVDVSEIDQRVYRISRCTRVETDRQRVYPDGRVVVDTIEATYRPAEGIDCLGNPIPRP